MIIRPNKKIELFLRHGRICLKNPTFCLFYFKNDEIKNAFSVQTLVIGNSHVVPLGRCGPLWVI